MVSLRHMSVRESVYMTNFQMRQLSPMYSQITILVLLFTETSYNMITFSSRMIYYYKDFNLIYSLAA